MKEKYNTFKLEYLSNIIVRLLKLYIVYTISW